MLEAKLDGSSWTPPTDKNSDGQWNLGDEPAGKLKFRFSSDPAGQKVGPKDPDPPKGTIVDRKSIIKPLITDPTLERNVDLLIRLLIEENSACQRELIDTIAQKYYLKFTQAQELIKAVNEEDKIYA